MSHNEYVWAIAMGPGSLVKYQVWSGAVDGDGTRVWAPLGRGPDGGGSWGMKGDLESWGMNDDIEFLED